MIASLLYLFKIFFFRRCAVLSRTPRELKMWHEFSKWCTRHDVRPTKYFLISTRESYSRFNLIHFIFGVSKQGSELKLHRDGVFSNDGRFCTWTTASRHCLFTDLANCYLLRCSLSLFLLPMSRNRRELCQQRRD